MGQVGILNVGAGDTKLVFNRDDPAECIRAARIVRDMIRRGYALLVDTGEKKDGRPVYQRAKDFIEGTCEYIIADFDSSVGESHEEAESSAEAPAGSATTNGRKTRHRKIHAADTNVVAVSRTAGG